MPNLIKIGAHKATFFEQNVCKCEINYLSVIMEPKNENFESLLGP